MTIRHIYNRSRQDWTIHIATTSGAIVKRAGGTHEDTTTNWKIPAKHYVQMEYHNFKGTFTLYDHRQQFVSYEVKGIKIKHKGSTRAMNLNHPANGDIDIWGEVIDSL